VNDTSSESRHFRISDAGEDHRLAFGMSAQQPFIGQRMSKIACVEAPERVAWPLQRRAFFSCLAWVAASPDAQGLAGVRGGGLSQPVELCRGAGEQRCFLGGGTAGGDALEGVPQRSSNSTPPPWPWSLPVPRPRSRARRRPAAGRGARARAFRGQDRACARSRACRRASPSCQS
jgi:hypothetical protein